MRTRKPDINQTLRDMGEDRFLAHVASLLHASGNTPDRLLLGLGDDAAVTAPSPNRMVWTVDSMVEGSHFRFWPHAGPPDWLGWKLAASNLSDLAAMGADPTYALLSLGVPGDATLADIEAFYKGLKDCLDQFGGTLIGGDTVRSPQWTLSLMVVGELHQGLPIASRARARPGHGIYATGALGESAAGFALLEDTSCSPAIANDERQRLIQRHLRPTPRVGLGLADRIPDICMMDLSDGLARDGARMANKSGVRLVIEEDRIPTAASLEAVAASADKQPLDFILHGGEDYELLFTGSLSPDLVTTISEASGVAITRIGTVEQGAPGLFLRTKSGDEIEITPQGFEHFA